MPIPNPPPGLAPLSPPPPAESSSPGIDRRPIFALASTSMSPIHRNPVATDKNYRRASSSEAHCQQIFAPNSRKSVERRPPARIKAQTTACKHERWSNSCIESKSWFSLQIEKKSQSFPNFGQGQGRRPRGTSGAVAAAHRYVRIDAHGPPVTQGR